MNVDEIKAKRKKLDENIDITLSNMKKRPDELGRVEEVAHNASQILDDLDREFESATGLDKKDILFLFAATGLQLARIYFVNELTKIEKAGQGELEDWLKKGRRKI